MVDKPGFKAITSRLYSHDDPLLERDAQFGVTRAPSVRSVRHEPGAEPAPAPGVTEPWYPPRLPLRRRARRGLVADSSGDR